MAKINQKTLAITVSAICAILFGFYIPAHAVSTFITGQGGTGTTSPSGILYGDNGGTTHLNTVSIGTGLTFSGGTLSSSGSGSGNVATSSSETSGRIPFWTSTSATPATLSGGSANFAWDNTNNLFTVTGSASTTNLSTSGRLYIDDGTSALPSLAFTSQTNTGFSKPATSQINVNLAGITKQKFTTSGIQVTSDGSFAFRSATNGSQGGGDTFIIRDAANVVALQNGLNPQGFRLYNTFTSTSNYERLGIEASTSANFFRSETVSGTARPFDFEGAKVGVGTSSPYSLLSIGGDVVVGAATAGGTLGDLYLPKLGTAAGSFIAVDATGKVIATTSPSGGGITAIGPTGQTQSGSTITIATSTSSFNGLTVSTNVIGSGNTLTWTPSLSGTLNNAGLTNSTISGIALGLNLADLTATNSTLTFSGAYNGGTARTVGLNLANPNTWTGLQTFTYASSTGISTSYASSTSFFAGNVNIPKLGTAAGTFLAADASGNIIATSTPSSGGTTFTSTQVYASAAPPTTLTDLDLSSVVGARTRMVMLRVTATITVAGQKVVTFCTKGDTCQLNSVVAFGANSASFQGTASSFSNYVIVKTDGNGVVQWGASSASNISVAVDVVSYW